MNQIKEQLLLTGAILLGFGIIISQFFLLFFATNNNYFNIYLALLIAEVLFFILVCIILYRKKFHKSKAQKLSKKILKYKQGKSDIVSFASHQLRTPLSILSGYIELLHDDVYGETSKKMKQVFTNMAITNERLLRVVEHFLCASEIGQASISYRFERENISKLIKKIIKELEYKSKENNVKVTEKIEENIYCDFDKQKLHHALYNIVDNSLKYSINKSVNITLKKNKSKVLFVCKDTGMGFVKKDKKKIGTKFYRSNISKQLGTKGTGLGLFVSKAFITVHNGMLSINSLGKGKGTTVRVTLPIIQRNQRKTFANV